MRRRRKSAIVTQRLIDDAEGPAAAKFIAEALKPWTFVAISDKTAFQAGIVQEVAQGPKKRGFDVVVDEFSEQERDLLAVAARIKSNGADFAYPGMIGPRTPLLLKQAGQAGSMFGAIGNVSIRERRQFVKASEGDAAIRAERAKPALWASR